MPLGTILPVVVLGFLCSLTVWDNGRSDRWRRCGLWHRQSTALSGLLLHALPPPGGPLGGQGSPCPPSVLRGPPSVLRAPPPRLLTCPP